MACCYVLKMIDWIDKSWDIVWKCAMTSSQWWSLVGYSKHDSWQHLWGTVLEGDYSKAHNINISIILVAYQCIPLNYGFAHIIVSGVLVTDVRGVLLCLLTIPESLLLEISLTWSNLTCRNCGEMGWVYVCWQAVVDEQWTRAMEYVNSVAELNYMTQIVIMLYEDPTKVGIHLRSLSNSWVVRYRCCGEDGVVTDRFIVFPLLSPCCI